MLAIRISVSFRWQLCVNYYKSDFSEGRPDHFFSAVVPSPHIDTTKTAPVLKSLTHGNNTLEDMFNLFFKFGGFNNLLTKQLAPS